MKSLLTTREKEKLERFSGNVIQSDGYSGYDSAVKYWNENHLDHQITHANCNVHARRKFSDSLKATKSKTAKEAVCIYKEIFKAENELRDKFEQKQITEEEFLKKLYMQKLKMIGKIFFLGILKLHHLKCVASGRI